MKPHIKDLLDFQRDEIKRLKEVVANLEAELREIKKSPMERALDESMKKTTEKLAKDLYSDSPMKGLDGWIDNARNNHNRRRRSRIKGRA